MTTSLMDLINQKKKAISSNREKTVKPPEGRSRWRILPSWRDAAHPQKEQFWHDFGQHFIKDGSGNLKAVYVCVDKTFGKPCSVCDAIQQGIMTSGDDQLSDTLKQASAAGRILVNAIMRGEDKADEPAILEIGPKLFGDFLGIMGEWGPEVLDLTNGSDVVIERTGKGLQTKYSIQIAAKSKPVSPEVMKKVKNLDEYVAQESEEQKVRAITNVRAVAGLLGSAAPSRPALGSVEDDLTLDGTLAVDDLAVASAPPSKPAAAAAAPTPEPAAVAESTGDVDLDALIDDLK